MEKLTMEDHDDGAAFIIISREDVEQLEDMMATGSNKYRVLSGYCPDEACRTQLFFPVYDSSIECTNCGQRHEQKSLKNIAEVTNPNVAIEKILRNILFGTKKPKKGPESVKVLGFSNYECKILSPFLTHYGMDKQSGKARLLSEMGQRETFDCGVLGDRAFLIEPDQMEVSGYGRDHTGSVSYLRETLDAIRKSNDDEDCILPIHADGDGHCLVHAVSRALIGRELFWHALRANLKVHFQSNLGKYKEIFSDFIDSCEWLDIIAECDPEFVPRDGEPMGLRNIHIFGLANILRRPIILLDSITGIQSSADYTGVFLPGLVEPDLCRGKDGQLNKPLCLAWSSNGHNHYIALVGVKGRPPPRLPGWMMPKSWGMPQQLLPKYIDLHQDQGCVIGGTKCLGDPYVLRLVNAMEEVFREKHGVSASLVADVNQYIYKSTGLVSVHPEVVIQETSQAVRENRLYRCFTCQALSQHTLLPEWFQPDGRLYELAIKSHGKLDPNKNYSFPIDGVICSYDEKEDCLIPDMSRTRLDRCSWCLDSKLRLVSRDGSIVYVNGDRTMTPTSHSKCQCGYRHYWDGKEYDNIPSEFPVTLEWGSKKVTETVTWFQDESDPALNSNVFEIAQKLVQKHFPGEFGSERLVQKVVHRILHDTAVATKSESGEGEEGQAAARDKENQADGAAWDQMTASKIILTGQAKKTLHKEELTKSQAERDLRQKIETKAGQSQRRRTMEESQRPANIQSPTKVSPKQQKTAQKLEGPKSSGSAVPTKGPSATAGPPKPSTGTRRVRVSTSDGRQSQISLEADTTYSGLQQLLAKHLQVPPDRQRIKVGFPPRELLPPADGQRDEPLGLQHGDRVTLEVLPGTTQVPPMIHSIPMQDSASDKLLQSITALQNESSDDIDRAVTSLTLMAGLTGTDLWTYAQTMPELFAHGGLFYRQFSRDLSLIDNKHCTLPYLPNKVFRYNAQEDMLELCLEPHGHFQVEPGIEERILGPSGSLSGDLQDLEQPSLTSALGMSRSAIQAALKSGSHGVQVDPKMNHPSPAHVPFSGKGQTLSGSSSKTQSLSGSKVMGPSTSGSSTSHSEQVSGQQVVPMETDHHPGEQTEGAEKAAPLFKRVGPGSRVLEPKSQNDANASIGQLMSMAKTLETVSTADQAPSEAQVSMLLSKVESLVASPTVGTGEIVRGEQLQKMEIEQCEPQQNVMLEVDDVDQESTPLSAGSTKESDSREKDIGSSVAASTTVGTEKLEKEEQLQKMEIEDLEPQQSIMLETDNADKESMPVSVGSTEESVVKENDSGSNEEAGANAS